MKRAPILTALAASAALLLAVGCQSEQDETPATETVTAQNPAEGGEATEATEATETGEVQPTNMMAELQQTCPIAAGDVTVQTSDTPNGVAMTFMTPSGNVDDLRTRVQHMAQMYNEQNGNRGFMWHHIGGAGQHMMGQQGQQGQHMMGQQGQHMMGQGQGMMGQGTMGQGQGAMGQQGQHMMGQGYGSGMGMNNMGMMPSVNASVENVDGGARMMLVPTDPTQRANMRAHIQMHASRMYAGECPMLELTGTE